MKRGSRILFLSKNHPFISEGEQRKGKKKGQEALGRNNPQVDFAKREAWLILAEGLTLLEQTRTCIQHVVHDAGIRAHCVLRFKKKKKIAFFILFHFIHPIFFSLFRSFISQFYRFLTYI